ncbi:HEAT repeat domain-containing protein [Thalassoglobus sp.]|uniref:HEAT repeat domain-containing protein n=1 Tax=Thalassoglobus sp. TaxID=2795869 RepID=UPI003AA7B5B3
MRLSTSLPAFFLFSCFMMNGDGVVADVIRLKNGGELRGQLEGIAKAEDAPVLMRTLSGALVEVERSEIDYVQRRNQVLEEYVSQSRAVDRTVEGHWALAEWCRTRRLKEQRLEQLELVLELDSDHKEARRGLGHVQHHGEWMPREEMMAQRGYVKHKNKWITTQELALIEKNTQQREAELVWYPKVRVWLGWITGNDAYRRNEGSKAFESLQDVDAIPALAKLMATHENLSVRILYIRVLGNMPGQRPVKALLDRYLFDNSEAVWRQALASIDSDQEPTAIPQLISALRNDSNDVVQRAAAALGEMGSEEAVPALISSLVTTHKYKIQVPDSQPISFGSTAGGRVGMMNPGQVSGTTANELQALARLGQLPHGAQVIPFHNVPKNMKTVTLRVDIKNHAVLTALEKITDKNLGFNERDWHLWWSVYKT